MTSFDGLSISTDTGMTFQLIDDAPSLVLLAGDDDEIIGVDLDGTVWRSEPQGGWSPVGTTPAQIHALVLLPSGEMVIATESGLQRSSDLGQTWHLMAP